MTLPKATLAALDVASRFGQARLVQQREQLARLRAALPLPLIELPRIPAPRLTTEHIELLASSLAAPVPEPRGIAWLRHNIEEVGAFEHFLPELYRRKLAAATSLADPRQNVNPPASPTARSTPRSTRC